MRFDRVWVHSQPITENSIFKGKFPVHVPVAVSLCVHVLFYLSVVSVFLSYNFDYLFMFAFLAFVIFKLSLFAGGMILFSYFVIFFLFYLCLFGLSLPCSVSYESQSRSVLRLGT